MKIAMKKTDQIAATVLLLVAAFVIYQSSQMTYQVEFAPGYGFFPLWLGILLAILSILLFVTARVRPGDQDENVEFPKREILINVVLILGGLALYAFLMEITGYVLDTLILVALLLGVVEREKWYKTLIAAVLMTAALYTIFEVILRVPLPKGIFGF